MVMIMLSDWGWVPGVVLREVLGFYKVTCQTPTGPYTMLTPLGLLRTENMHARELLTE